MSLFGRSQKRLTGVIEIDPVALKIEGWETIQDPRKLKALADAMSLGVRFHPVPLKQHRENPDTVRLSQSYPNPYVDGIIGMPDGGHNRALAAMIAGVPLRAMIVKGKWHGREPYQPLAQSSLVERPFVWMHAQAVRPDVFTDAYSDYDACYEAIAGRLEEIRSIQNVSSQSTMPPTSQL